MPDKSGWIPFSCMPTFTGAGIGVARIIRWNGAWEKEISIRSQSDELVGQLNNNSARHGGPPKAVNAEGFRRPFAQQGPVQNYRYTVECHYKEASWNPDAAWHGAIGRRLGEGPQGALFAWWTPEAGGEAPRGDAPNGVFSSCVLAISYQDNILNIEADTDIEEVVARFVSNLL